MAGGRPKGSLTANTQHLQDLMNYYNFDPAEVLILLGQNNWEALGYSSAIKTTVTKDGTVIESDTIPIDNRQRACETLMSYIFPKRRAVEISTQDGLAPLILAYNTETKKPEENK